MLLDRAVEVRLPADRGVERDARAREQRVLRQQVEHAASEGRGDREQVVERELRAAGESPVQPQVVGVHPLCELLLRHVAPHQPNADLASDALGVLLLNP
ncbi:hypothetical protein [Nocardioides zeae]|uniref:hypothetical protein n=1 Tax=Nocardioides zeae TaxID=1457234 RepID=UPI00286AE90F|nr:hypothetical protein [Nocardioides zeae]